MKERTGHVSNSSSTSFLLFATKEAFEEVANKQNELTRHVANEVGKKYTRKFGSQDMVIIKEFTWGDSHILDDISPPDSYPKPPEDKDEKWEWEDDWGSAIYEAWRKFSRTLSETRSKDLIVEYDFEEGFEGDEYEEDY